MSVEEHFQRVGTKLNELVKKYELLQKENERLRSELGPAKEREMQFLEQIDRFEQKILLLKAGNGRMADDEKKELDRKLHFYLKEIDRCITMLSE